MPKGSRDKETHNNNYNNIRQRIIVRLILAYSIFKKELNKNYFNFDAGDIYRILNL